MPGALTPDQPVIFHADDSRKTAAARRRLRNHPIITQNDAGKETDRFMIGYIKGTAEELNSDSVIVECQNVGFLIYVPGNYPYGKINPGDEVKLYTHMSVREDDISLFGFLTKEDLNTYELLLGVSGVGPKAAMGILSAMDADSLRLAVLTDDAASIARSPGIGKKTAQKIILELKDKLSLEDLQSVQSVTKESLKETDFSSDAAAALVALGYSNSESLKAVRKAAAETGSDDPEVLLKAALKKLF